MLLFSDIKKVFLQQQPVEESMTSQLASVALLVEIMRVDGELKQQEKKYLFDFVKQQYGLEQQKVKELIQLANIRLEQATDYYQFTSTLNQQLSINEKIDLVSRLWKMANVDQHIDAHEEHVIRKLADLLHLRHSEYIRAKNAALMD